MKRASDLSREELEELVDRLQNRMFLEEDVDPKTMGFRYAWDPELEVVGSDIVDTLTDTLHGFGLMPEERTEVDALETLEEYKARTQPPTNKRWFIRDLGDGSICENDYDSYEEALADASDMRRHGMSVTIESWEEMDRDFEDEEDEDAA